MLPNGTKPCLNSLGILKFAYLLKLVNTYNDVTVFAFGNHLNHIQYFFWAMRFRSDAKRHADLRDWIYRKVNFGCKSGKKVFGFIHPQLNFGGCLFQYRCCQDIIEIVFALTAKYIQSNSNDITVLQLSADMIHQRCFAPTTWGYQNRIDAILKILFQATGFFFTSSKIVVCNSYSINKTLLHNLLNLRAKIAKRI